MEFQPGYALDDKRITLNPNDEFFKQFLKPYYVFTKDGQYLFASTQMGRRPDKANYMVPASYKLGKNQNRFDPKVGKKLYEIVMDYLKTCKVIVQDGIQGESEYETGVRVVTSIENPHAAYMAWMIKLMIFPPKKGVKPKCFNYVVQERLPEEYQKRLKAVWPQYDPDSPLTLYDLSDMDKDVRRVMSLRVDYFGGAYKKPHLTLVWNRGEGDGMVSYHAGCTSDRVMKGLSGTGKTTLSVGPDLEQDDALLGKPEYGKNGKIKSAELIGLEAASFAKSQGLVPDSPEWPGLMKSAETGPNGKRPVVLAMNIDCEGVRYVMKKIAGHDVKVPEVIPGQKVGGLQCTKYDSSGTTNGRFIFLFSELNPGWGSGRKKYLKSESLSFKRFEVLDPAFRVTDPVMAVALDSGCETIITSAILGQKTGTRVRSYAATDFMVREQSQQALLKLKMYSDMGLGEGGKLVFFIVNAGSVGEFDINGNQVLKEDEHGNKIPVLDDSGKSKLNDRDEPMYLGQGEKITVRDSKALVDLIEHRKIKKWIKHQCYGYLLPDPKELEQVHGMKDFSKRFNLLRFYTPEQIIEFWKRDIMERTGFMKDLFKGQTGAEKLKEIIGAWEKCKIPSPKEVRDFYEKNYGKV
ncbi:MAG: phosphoenolpyruvate carboxykinase (ATP) [archaeon]